MNYIHIANVVHKAAPVPPRTRRSERREQTLKEVVDAALRLVDSSDFDGWTMQALAAELGFAVGALYRYFPSKDALLLAVQRRVLEQLSSDVSSALAFVDDPRASLSLSALSLSALSLSALSLSALSPQSHTLVRLLCAVGAYRALPGRRPPHFNMLARWLADPRPLVDTAAAVQHVPALLALFHPVALLFDDAVAAGALSPGHSERRVIALWGALHGVLQLNKMARFGLAAFDADALTDHLVRTLCLGWGADPDALDQASRRLQHLKVFSSVPEQT